MHDDSTKGDTVAAGRNEGRIVRLLSRYDCYVFKDGDWKRREPLQWWLTREIARTAPPGATARPTRLMRRLKAAGSC